MAKSSAEAPGMAPILDGEDEELDPVSCTNIADMWRSSS